MSSGKARWLTPFIAVVFALVMGEILLRTVFHVAPQVDLNIYCKDKFGNLRLQPNVDKQHVTPLWDVAVRTNEEGWRDTTDELAPIVGLGDSFAFGWGVEESEGLYRLLEAELGRRILNGAVPATGTADQARLLQKVLWNQRPDTVLLALFVGNDFHDNLLGGGARYEVESGSLVQREQSGQVVRARIARLARRPRIVQLVRALQFRYFRASGGAGEPRNWDDWMRRFAQVHQKDAPESLFEETAMQLDRLQGLCAQLEARLAVIVIPRSWQVEPQGLAAMTEALEIDPNELDVDRPQRFLRDWGADRGVEVIDLLPAFRQSVADEPQLRLYHSPDAHWTAAGHAIAAEAAAQALRARP